MPRGEGKGGGGRNEEFHAGVFHKGPGPGHQGLEHPLPQKGGDGQGGQKGIAPPAVLGGNQQQGADAKPHNSPVPQKGDEGKQPVEKGGTQVFLDPE